MNKLTKLYEIQKCPYLKAVRILKKLYENMLLNKIMIMLNTCIQFCSVGS